MDTPEDFAQNKKVLKAISDRQESGGPCTLCHEFTHSAGVFAPRKKNREKFGGTPDKVRFCVYSLCEKCQESEGSAHRVEEILEDDIIRDSATLIGSAGMKVNMLGRDITVTRESMLSDGYCLSTVNHAERLAFGPETYVVASAGEESGGVIWLRGHIPFCHQCKTANEMKNRITDYIGRHFPTRVTDWHQGRLPGGMMGQIVSSLFKADREFVILTTGYSEYNLKPLHTQAVFDRNALLDEIKESLGGDDPHITMAVEKSRIIMVDTSILFKSWQLLGSGPLYEEKRLIKDFNEFKIRPPFPSTYLAFPEGINRHLIEHFFDNMPADLFGQRNIKGVMLSESIGGHGVVEHDFAEDVLPPANGELSRRFFLWFALLRAIQDKVFTADVAPEFERERDEYLHAVGRAGAKRKPPEPFYAVRVNPDNRFSDPARVYGKRHINWTHRWDVAGHWRAYKDGKRVWIASYIKGPDDKPFVPGVRVYGQEAAEAGRQFVGKTMLNRFMAWVRSFRRVG